MALINFYQLIRFNILIHLIFLAEKRSPHKKNNSTVQRPVVGGGVLQPLVSGPAGRSVGLRLTFRQTTVR